MIDKMVNKYLILLLTLAVLGCDSPKKEFHVAEFEEEKQFDTEEYLRNLPLEDIFIKTTKRRYNYKVSAINGVLGYTPFYLGKKLPVVPIDNLFLDSNFITTENHNYKEGKDSTSIQIFVDTTRKIPNTCNIVNLNLQKNNLDSSNYLPTLNHSAYAVFIENISDDTLEVGSSNGLPLHLQILSPNGTWLETNHFVPGCGTGLRSYLIAPRHITITNHPITSGNTITKFRFAYGYKKRYWDKSDYIYSNEFYGKIDSAFFTNKNTPF